MRQEEKKCWYCRGKGEQVCKRCGGSGLVPQLDLSFISVIGASVPIMIPCKKCGGTGMARCSHCHGTGKR